MVEFSPYKNGGKVVVVLKVLKIKDRNTEYVSQVFEPFSIWFVDFSKPTWEKANKCTNNINGNHLQHSNKQ